MIKDVAYNGLFSFKNHNRTTIFIKQEVNHSDATVQTHLCELWWQYVNSVTNGLRIIHLHK